MTLDDMLHADGDETPDPGDRPAPRPRRRPSPLTVIGLVLILAGASALGWVGYQYFGTNVVSEKQFTEQKKQLRETWDVPDRTKEPGDELDKAVPGDAVALLRVPSWGKDFEVPILKGTDLDILSRGVGMYASSVNPGKVGNFAIAGHRITHGEPFSRLLELEPGDQVIIETRTQIFTYVMDNSPADLTVDDSATWVLDPVPGKPKAKPSKALLTLTTCQDLFHSPDRSIGFAHLEDTVNK